MEQEGDVILSAQRKKEANKSKIKHLISETPDPALEVTDQKRHPVVLQ